MPYVPVPKDLTKVKSKVAFNLTKRQLICFGAGGLVGIPTYIFTRGSIGNEAAVMLMIVLMLPFFLFGIFEKDGQPLEKVLGHFIRARFIPGSRTTQKGVGSLRKSSSSRRLRRRNCIFRTRRPGCSPPAGRRRRNSLSWTSGPFCGTAGNPASRSTP